MFAKSHAKLFFIGGTAVFSAAFLFLTVDTLAQVPARSHESTMTPQVLRGRMIWDKNNCMGCHTLLGEGGYYAPELTKVVDRRGKDWMRVFLRDPEAMFPGERRMVNYHFDDAQIDDLIAFFEWIGNVDTNGFPPKPDLVAGPPPKPVELTGRLANAPSIFKSTCMGCHSLDGQGGNVGPALDGLSARYSPETLDAWLADPASVKPGTKMPNLSLSPEVRRDLADFLLPSPKKAEAAR